MENIDRYGESAVYLPPVITTEGESFLKTLLVYIQNVNDRPNWKLTTNPLTINVHHLPGYLKTVV